MRATKPNAEKNEETEHRGDETNNCGKGIDETKSIRFCLHKIIWNVMENAGPVWSHGEHERDDRFQTGNDKQK